MTRLYGIEIVLGKPKWPSGSKEKSGKHLENTKKMIFTSRGVKVPRNLFSAQRIEQENRLP